MEIRLTQIPPNSGPNDGEMLRHTKLKSAAHEFEASLMQELIRPMQHDPLGESSDASSSDDAGSGNAVVNFGSETLARAISERGGFGIARKVLEHFGEGDRSK